MATIILSKDVALAAGVTAFALLIGLQLIIAWLSVRSPSVGTDEAALAGTVVPRGIGSDAATAPAG